MMELRWKQSTWMTGVLALLWVGACEQAPKTPAFPTPTVKDTSQVDMAWPEGLDRATFEDKVLGMLVGSAIGDAMGAPTEMWHRDDIRIQLGYVDDLDALIREGSPEGPWAYNMPGGGTTDDTRWKYLFSSFAAQTWRGSEMDPKAFAGFIIDLYLQEQAEVRQVEDFDPESLETEMRHMTWLQEWAKVAKPYVDGDLDGYSHAASKFYGGEMSCAGMLYAPMVGLYYPGAPEAAYSNGYNLGLFDLGYARDITGLTAAYVARAMLPGVGVEDIGALTRLVDPQDYFKSRLVGRIANRVYQDARRIAYEARQIDAIPDGVRVPAGYPYEPLYFAQVEEAYRHLDGKLQDIPFHAGEIHLINLTALEFGAGDFRKTIEFVVNYGRDNDTVGAVTGAILGAWLGASQLPADWYTKAIKTNRETVGIDLEELARQVVQTAYRGPS